MKQVIPREAAPPVVLHRSGQEITLNQGGFRKRFGVRSSPLAELFVSMFTTHLQRDATASAEVAMNRAQWELDCAVAASNKRRFRRCFGRAS